MNKEIAKRICEQMTEDIDNLCNCPRKDEKIIHCYGCRELAIKTLLDYINQLETNRDEAIEYIKHSWRLKFDQIYDVSKDLRGWEAQELLSLLERGKE